MSRLIVLSNRVKLPNDKQAGGLAVAMSSALQQRGGIWLGWNGDVVANSPNAFSEQTHGNVTYITTALSQAQYQHFYCGFANNVLWAFLHDRADLMAENAEDFAMYQRVNAQFARQLRQLAEPDDVIWVHDYHFLSVAHYCRQLGMANRIGFFSHIPFASSEQWQCCPFSKILLANLSDYDVIGVQTQADKRHCQAVLAPFLTANPPKIDSYPIGVDVAHIRQQVEHLTATKSDVIRIIAVDRIDYTKGIVRRLQAFAEFLRRYPDYQGKIQLYQIACPSRLDLPIYQHWYDTVQAEVASVQQAFATADWQPIRYSEAVLGHDELMQVFFDSEICWVNSLKDGMNLVAKEYITAQNPENAGVLMLSKYAGASEQMQKAIIIDPYDRQNLVESLFTAVTLSAEEKQRRYYALMDGLIRQDLWDWQNRFLQDLASNQV